MQRQTDGYGQLLPVTYWIRSPLWHPLLTSHPSGPSRSDLQSFWCPPWSISWCASSKFRNPGQLNSHAWLIQVCELYTDRAALEREYAVKLQQFAKKAGEKKNKSALSLVVGDNPAKACTESIIQQKHVHSSRFWPDTHISDGSTLNRAYSEILSSMSNSAQDQINLSEALSSQIAGSLKAVKRRNDDYKKKVYRCGQSYLCILMRYVANAVLSLDSSWTR